MRELGAGRFLAAGIGGVTVPVFEFMYGAGDAVVIWMFGVLLFIALDWLSGYRASQKDRSYASKYGIDGVFRTFFMLLLPAGGHVIDLIFQLPGVAFGILVGGLLFHTIKSMTANAVRAGWGDWLPLSALELITNWVQSEIESKISRASKRNEDKRL